MIKRAISALVGIPLFIATLFEAYLQSFGFYAEHYALPMKKYGVRTPLRRQDIVFLAVFWPIAVAFLYVSSDSRGSPFDKRTAPANYSQEVGGSVSRFKVENKSRTQPPKYPLKP